MKLSFRLLFDLLVTTNRGLINLCTLKVCTGIESVKAYNMITFHPEKVNAISMPGIKQTVVRQHD